MTDPADPDGRISVTEIDKEHLTVTDASERAGDHLDVLAQEGHDQAIIVVNQLYGPKGDPVVGISDVRFDGLPAVTVGVRTDRGEELVHFSPIHGDRRHEGGDVIPLGARVTYFCPVSKEPLAKVGNIDDGSGARYYALFLTPRLDRGSTVMISDIWGHHHSRILDEMELISYWANMEPEVRESMLPPPPKA